MTPQEEQKPFSVTADWTPERCQFTVIAPPGWEVRAYLNDGDTYIKFSHEGDWWIWGTAWIRGIAIIRFHPETDQESDVEVGFYKQEGTLKYYHCPDIVQIWEGIEFHNLPWQFARFVPGVSRFPWIRLGISAAVVGVFILVIALLGLIRQSAIWLSLLLITVGPSVAYEYYLHLRRACRWR